MIEINLAPGAGGRRSSKRARSAIQLPTMPGFALGGDSRAVAVGGAGLLAALAVGFGFWQQGAERTTLQAQIDQEVTDSIRFATTITLINTLQARQDTITQKIGVIREVDQRRYVWPHLLNEISHAVPAYTWLTQIGSTAAPPPPAPAEGAPAPAPSAGPTITLQGNAGSTQALTRLMKNLEASPFVEGVTLVTSEQVDVEGRALHRFSLEARYQLPDSTAVETIPIVVVN